jgi:hypothetical protein
MGTMKKEKFQTPNSNPPRSMADQTKCNDRILIKFKKLGIEHFLVFGSWCLGFNVS